MQIMRPEYPNPQFERKNWTNLNGEWEFEIDTGKSGEERGVHEKAHLDGKINVPFCPESKLSGIGNTDFRILSYIFFHLKLLFARYFSTKITILQ